MQFLYVCYFVLLMSCSPFLKYSEMVFSNKSIVVMNANMSPALSQSPVINWQLQGIDQSLVQSYEICLGSNSGACDAINWVNVGVSNTHTFEQDLNPSTTYYVNVRYIDKTSGVTSEAFSGNAFVTPANSVKYIKLGYRHTCALNFIGEVKCWGTNNSGQLGYDDTLQRGHAVSSMIALNNIDFGIGRKVKSLAVGNNHNCVVLDNNELKCWGDNSYGQLGYDDSINKGGGPGDMASLSPVDVGVGRTVKMFSLGADHTCAILDNDQVKCWGANNSGQLGYDDTISRGHVPGSMMSLSFVNLGIGRTAKMISAGSGFTCAILDNNQVKCWGANNFGQLGYDDPINKGDIPGSMASLSTVDLGIGSTAKYVAAGTNHTCAILDNDQVKCWGRNFYGQLGYDDTVLRGNAPGTMSLLAYVNLGIGRTAKSISIKNNSTCVLLDNNQAKCWGRNDVGQLGYNDNISRGNSFGSMSALNEVNFGSGRSVVNLDLGHSYACAVLDNYQIKCWGQNDYGQLGYDDISIRANTPESMVNLSTVNLGFGRTAKTVVIGGSHSCAILDNDQLKCWGYNLDGQLGYDDNMQRGHTPGSMSTLSYVDLGVGRTAKQVSLGTDHTCVILDNDQVKCWGANAYGQLGYDDTAKRGHSPGSMSALSYVDLGVGRTAKYIELGEARTCVILDNDQVKCWGMNNYGQLGYDDTTVRGDSPGSMSALSYVDLGVGRTAKKIDTGSYHTCAILDNDQVKCWGYNWNGQLGYDDNTQRGHTAGSMSALAYINLGVGRTAKSVSLGYYHTCVLLDNDTMKCFGKNDNGQLGYDDTSNRGNNPGDMASLPSINLGVGRTVVDIFSGSYHTCAVLDNDQLKCWGANGYGQLGYDDLVFKSISTGQMTSLAYINLGLGRTAKAVTASGTFTCAILDNDQVKCWGYNYNGQLGYDDRSSRGGSYPMNGISIHGYIP